MIKTYIHSAIDTIQTSKKMFVDTFVKHEALAKSFNEFVDTQTDYTKKAFDASVETGTKVYNAITDKTFYTDALKAVQETATQFVSKKSK